MLIIQPDGKRIDLPQASPTFREVNYGALEGYGNEEAAILASAAGGKRLTSLDDMIDVFGFHKQRDLIHEADPSHLAENGDQTMKRIEEGNNILRKLPDGSTAVVVSHGAIIRFMATMIGDQPDSAYDILDNGSITKVTFTDHDAHLDFYNQHQLPSNNS